MAMDFSGLFQSPEEIRQNRLDLLQQRNSQLAGMGGSMSGLLGQVAAGRGAQLAEATAQAFGMKTKAEAEAAKNQEIMANTQLNDTTSLKAAIEKFKEAGNAKAVTMLSQQLTQVENQNWERNFKTKEFDWNKKYQQAALKLQQEEFSFNKSKYDDLAPQRKAELNKLTTAAEDERLQKQGLSEMIKKPWVLETLGFSADMIQQMTDADTPEVYFQTIKDRLSEISTGDYVVGVGSAGAGQDPTAKMQEEALFNARIQKVRDLEAAGKKGTPEWEKANSEALSAGNIYGAFDGDSMFKQRSDEAEKAFVESEKSIESIDEVLGYMDAMNYDLKTGYDATVSDAIAKFMGEDSPELYIRTQIRSIRNKIALQDLPPGAASDADVKLVLEGTLDPNASPKMVARWLRGIKKINQARKDRSLAFSEYSSSATNRMRLSGFNDWYTSKLKDDRKSWLKNNIKGITEAELNDAANLSSNGFKNYLNAKGWFEEKAGANSADALQERLDALK